jgi:aminoglycoside phosphotransferase (APT) family kinase protein
LNIDFAISGEEMSDKKINITETLVHHLITQQFPQWQHLPIQPVKNSGWDNRTFHLGADMLIRMPSAAEYEGQAEKEQTWLPVLAPRLPLPIPSPIAMGKPNEIYPWKWSINRWLPGDSSLVSPIDDICHFAKHLALFLKALQSIDATFCDNTLILKRLKIKKAKYSLPATEG